MAKKKKSSEAKTPAKSKKPNSQSSSRPTQEKTKQPAAKKPGKFPIVGIGASAGGLEALQKFFAAVPEKSDLAFVVILHLDPTRKSLAAELLSHKTSMRVVQVEDEPHVQPNCVYVIPPNQYLAISNGELQLSPPDRPRGSRMAVDHFFRALAEDQRQCAVGVVLSGTGTDGTLGLKAIKEAGGLAIAQDPDTAEHEGMLRSAIQTGVVDYILAPEKIPAVLCRYTEHPYIHEAEVSAESETKAEEGASPKDAEGLEKILQLLRKHTRHEFRNYKDKTLIRRTRRRMCLHHIEEYPGYLEYLKQHPPEIELLAKDLLITVTDFFRDPPAWKELLRLAIAPIVEKREADEPIRVWSPGCATGEEPYSIAMLFLEELKKAGKHCPLQVFASDIDKEAIEFAREGRYPKSIAADVSPERLRRFFVSHDDDDFYHVNKVLREAVIFARQNLIGDPPFSQLDLLCCRNLLIYLKPEVQEKVIGLFHFALRPDGVLMLGSAETIGRQSDLFQTLDKRWRIFRRWGPTRHDRVDIPLSTQPQPREQELITRPSPRRDSRLVHLAQQRLLDMLAPNAVLIDSNWHILYICGDVDAYVTHPSGVPCDNLLDKIRRGLRPRLRGAVLTAFSERRTVIVKGRVHQKNAVETPVTITVRLIHDSSGKDDLALVLFDKEDADTPALPSAEQKLHKPEQPSGESDDSLDEPAILRQLEEELADVKDDLQNTVEQLEASTEEYKASNEEVMSINEELQSTNEELETSKEELQSLNEELTTVNNQLSSKVEELETKNADLENLLAVTSIATVCLDTDLTVRWFTPAAQEVFRLKPSDHGRSLADFAHDFVDGDLTEIAAGVLQNLKSVEDEVKCHDGRSFLRRVTPYRTDDHRIGGVVITLVDITQRKQDEEKLMESQQLLRQAAQAARFGSYSYDIEKNEVVDWSPELLSLHGLEEGTPIRRETIEALVHPEDREQFALFAEHALSRAEGEEFENEFRIIRPQGEVPWLSYRGSLVYEGEKENRRPKLAVGMVLDVTARKEAQLAQQKFNDNLEGQVKQRTEMLRMLQDITRIANEAQNVEEALRAVMERICRHNGFQVGHAWKLADDESGELISTGIWHLDTGSEKAIGNLAEFKKVCEQTRFAPQQLLVGQVASSAEPRWIDDIPGCEYWLRGDAKKLGLHAVIAFPLLADGEVAAVLEFFSDQPTNREERFMEIMPDVGIQLGHVVKRKRMEREIADAMSEQQRYFGRELHDSVAQHLTGLALMAESMRLNLESANSGQAQEAAVLVEHLREAQTQVRRLSRGLMPVEVDSAGLEVALEELCEFIRQAHHIECLLEGDGPVEVEDNDTATHLYRIAQEAVQNALKHGKPRRIAIKLSHAQEELILSIQNDGAGIPKIGRIRFGSGMRIMEYRAGMLGGALTFQSHPVIGTTVVCKIPNPS